MKFSKHESAALVVLIGSGGTDVSIEDLSVEIYQDRPRPKGWRKSVSATMRMLQMKCAVLGGPVQFFRKSRLGAGGKAVYCTTKKASSNRNE